MRLPPDQVEKVAHLARLAIDDAGIEVYAQDLSRILELVEQMNTVDTSGIGPMAQRLRPDVVTEGNQRELFQCPSHRV